MASEPRTDRRDLLRQAATGRARHRAGSVHALRESGPVRAPENQGGTTVIQPSLIGVKGGFLFSY